MMDRDDVLDLLAIIASIDRRTVGEGEIATWLQIIGDLPKDDCVNAIIAFRREQPDTWLQPGHIVARVKAIVRDRYERLDVDAAERGRQEALWDSKASSGELTEIEAYPSGRYQQFDPAGWAYGGALTREDRGEAAVELDARIDELISHRVMSRLDAERDLRLADRARAEAFLRDMGQSRLINFLGDQQAEDRAAPAQSVAAPHEPMRAFSEPIHLQGEDE